MENKLKLDPISAIDFNETTIYKNENIISKPRKLLIERIKFF